MPNISEATFYTTEGALGCLIEKRNGFYLTAAYLDEFL